MGPICGEWSSALEAVHIAPDVLGHEGAAQIFGEPPEKGHDIIWDVENGLPMRYDMRRRFDTGEFALQPVRDEMDPMGFVTNEMDHTGPISFIFLLFNKEIGDRKMNCEKPYKTFKQMRGQKI
jgi:hypothetical protein